MAVLGIKIQQQSRLTKIKEGDANTKLFPLRATTRRWKNFIPALATATGMVIAQQDKANTATVTLHTLNWELMDIQCHNLDHLDVPLTKGEVRGAIFDSLAEKALGPDRYIGLFYKTCSAVICNDLMQGLHQANIVLLPKMEDPARITDYRPISLMQCC